MKKLLVAAIVILIASPAFAAIQDVKISGDIVSTFIDRQGFYLGFNGPDVFPSSAEDSLKKQDIFVTQTRLRVDADLTDKVSASVGLINERAWNAENNYGPNATDVQLYLASVTMRELLYSPLTVTVGRQIFFYGNGMIMGNGAVRDNVGGNFKSIAWDLTERPSNDGIKAVFDFKPLTLDVFYFKSEQTPGSIEGLGALPSGQSSDVFGYNANYQLGDRWNTVVEQYMFSRIDGSGFTDYTYSYSAKTKGNTIYAPGLHVSTNPIKGLNVSGEIAWELGQQPVVASNGAQEAEHRDAMAGMLLVNYALPVWEKYKPSVNAAYMYFSGDKNGGENYASDKVKSAKEYTAWDTMFAMQAPGYIYNTIFGPTNIQVLAVGASASPVQDVTASVEWNYLFTVEPYSGQNMLVVIQPNGDFMTPATTKKSDLGNETDINLNYAYTEDVNFGLLLGWYVPGEALSKSNRDTASQALASVGVKF